MQTVRCPRCRTTRDVAAYLALLPLRCTTCGGPLVAGAAVDEPIVLQAAPNEAPAVVPESVAVESVAAEPIFVGEPKATIVDDPVLPPLVPLPREVMQPLPSRSDESSARMQLSDKLREIVALTPSEPLVELTPAPQPSAATDSPPASQSSIAKLWNRVTGR